jgi:hypothetical protein
MRIGKWTAAAGATAVVIGAYSAYWLIAAGKIEHGLERWAEERRAEGYKVELGHPVITGFPTHFQVDIPHPLIGREASGWVWQPEHLHAEAPPWQVGAMEFTLSGRHALRLLSGDHWQDIAGTIERGHADLRVDSKGRLTSLDIEISDYEIDSPGFAAPATGRSLTLSSRHDYPEAPDHQSETVSLSLRLDGLALPPETNPGLGKDVERIALDAVVKGPLTDAKLSRALADWRDAGGTVEVDRLELRWGPVGLETNGTLALDPEMRPLGAFAAKIIGYGDVVDALVINELVPLGDAFLFKIAFNLLAKPSEPGGPPALDLPLTVQDGSLVVGSVRLMEVPPLLPPETSVLNETAP